MSEREYTLRLTEGEMLVLVGIVGRDLYERVGRRLDEGGDLVNEARERSFEKRFMEEWRRGRRVR